MKKIFLTSVAVLFVLLSIKAEVLCNYVENESILDIHMIYVEGGTFQMGTNKDRNREIDEENVHSVTLDDFFIGKTEITIAQFAKFVEETNYKTDAEIKGRSYIWDDEKALMVEKEGVNWRCNEVGNYISENDYSYYPVVYISWQDGVKFCEWLSSKTGKCYSLPTEAEWEYAARGGKYSKGYIYSGSKNVKKVAWYWDDSLREEHPVANLLANELGVYDMSGNVYEWCQDWYEDRYPTETQENPKGPQGSNKLFRRVIRGGSWATTKEFCRVTNRDSGNPSLGTSTSGFRIVCRMK